MIKPRNFLVNDLLSISRLPDHFHAMVNGLEGREALYSNPGIALRSYVVANCLRKHVELVSDKDLMETIHECNDFNRNGKIKITIMEMLIKQSIDLVYEISILPTNVHAKFNEVNKITLTSLNSQMLSVKTTLDGGLKPDDLSHVASLTTMDDQILFDLEESINMLTFQLSLVPTQPTAGAA